MNEPSRFWFLAVFALAVTGCQDATDEEPVEFPLSAISAEAALQETRNRVRDSITDPDSAAALLDALANARDEFREGNRAAARAQIHEFVRRLEGIVESGKAPPDVGDELLLYAGDALSTIGFTPLCALTPGAAPPVYLYSSRVVCVERLPFDPADPETALPPDSIEHCNPVAKSLQLELLDNALAVCRADPYGCVPVAGTCPARCQKDVEPGLTAPRVRFTADSVNCTNEPVKKHSCVAIGFYYCSCSCTPIEDI